MPRAFFSFLFALSIWLYAGAAAAQEAQWPESTSYHFQQAGTHKIFYRAAGKPDKPVLLLLHGYPSSSHTYRALIPLLSSRFRVIAPDNLGSGYSDKPNPATTVYDFDLLADTLYEFIEALDIQNYTLYMQDFGAPVGFRLMMRDPKRVQAIIVQNANAYLEGMPEEKQQFFNNAQLDKSPENVARLYDFTSVEAIKFKQYLRDVKGKEGVMSPDSWTHDSHFLQTPEQRKIQVQLFQDYKTNLDQYPKWQVFLRERQFPTLIVWGKNDPVFTAAGARAYLRDVPNAQLHLLDAGHFAVEEKPVDIARHIIRFLSQIK